MDPEPSPARTAVALVLVVFVSAALPVPAFAADGDIKITGVTVSPDNPAPDEEVTFTASITNRGSSDVTINKIELTNGTDDVIETVDTLGVLEPGESLDVPLTESFDDTGVRHLRVKVYAEDENANKIRRTHFVAVNIQETKPRLDAEAPDAVADTQSNVSIDVSNPLDDPIRNVDLTIDGDAVSVEDNSKFKTKIAGGDTATFQYAITAESAGDQTIEATLTYTTGDANRRTVTETMTLSFDELNNHVALSTKPTAGNQTGVEVTINNLGNAPIEAVTVTGDAEGAQVSQALVDEVPAHDSKIVTLDVSGLDAGTATVDVTVDYDIGTTSDSVSTSTEVASAPGQIQLTGVSVIPEGGVLHISGSASNVGLTDAKSVVVSVKSTDSVTPAEPNRNYFVGKVGASDFLSFDVYAKVDDDVSAIPLEVAYLVDGERYQRTVEVPYEGDTGANQQLQQPQPARSGGPPIPIVPAAVGIVVIVAVVIAWRRIRA